MNGWIQIIIQSIYCMYLNKVRLTNERFEIYTAMLFFVETVGASSHPQRSAFSGQSGPCLVVREDHQLGQLLHWSHGWLTSPTPSRSSETNNNLNIILQQSTLSNTIIFLQWIEKQKFEPKIFYGNKNIWEKCQIPTFWEFM